MNRVWNSLPSNYCSALISRKLACNEVFSFVMKMCTRGSPSVQLKLFEIQLQKETLKTEWSDETVLLPLRWRRLYVKSMLRLEIIWLARLWTGECLIWPIPFLYLLQFHSSPLHSLIFLILIYIIPTELVGSWNFTVYPCISHILHRELLEYVYKSQSFFLIKKYLRTKGMQRYRGVL